MEKGKWEKTYRAKTIVTVPDVNPLIQNNTAMLTGGKALDIAMGMGQNGIFLASHGYDVTGIDRSSAAVSLAMENAEKNGVAIKACEGDILSYDIRENHFDVILNFYYLERGLIPKIKKGLRNNGLLFFETYTAEQSRFGHPRNPEYLLKPNELLNFFLDFFILYYHERIEESKAVAGIIAQKI